MNPVTITLIVNAISFALVHFLGVNVENNALTITVQTLVLLGTSIWAWAHHSSVVAQARAAGAHI